MSNRQRHHYQNDRNYPPSFRSENMPDYPQNQYEHALNSTHMDNRHGQHNFITILPPSLIVSASYAPPQIAHSTINIPGYGQRRFQSLPSRRINAGDITQTAQSENRHAPTRLRDHNPNPGSSYSVRRQSYSAAIPAYGQAGSSSAPRLVSTDSVASPASTHRSEASTSDVLRYTNHLDACLADREREERQQAKKRESEQQRHQAQDQSRHSILQVSIESDTDPDVPSMASN
ncbi:hypothetical protein Ddc_06904 [Ditylenchus destructor]|nr:hypothetical protein Ddc_06904 [Ditylenchus destructor]